MGGERHYSGNYFYINKKHLVKCWSIQERNSSTLLFSALVTRVFGVKRDRDNEFSSKNGTLTARAFFQKYPGLFEVIGSELRAAADAIEVSRGALSPLEASLYPILILLAKLQPSPVSTSFNEFQVRLSLRRSLLRLQ